jgi:alkanesulfonate monooxygenase
LVGSYDHVAEELARYMTVGYMTFILDVPPSEEELHHVNMVFARASQMQIQKGVSR